MCGFMRPRPSVADRSADSGPASELRAPATTLPQSAARYGPSTSRFPITEKVHFNKAVPLSDRIELDQERCILCWRCTRFYEEITGEKELVLQERGVHTL